MLQKRVTLKIKEKRQKKWKCYNINGEKFNVKLIKKRTDAKSCLFSTMNKKKTIKYSI